MANTQDESDKTIDASEEEKVSLSDYMEFLNIIKPGDYYRDLYLLDSQSRTAEMQLFNTTKAADFPFPARTIRVPPNISQIEFLKLLYGPGSNDPLLKAAPIIRQGLKGVFHRPTAIIVFNAEYLSKSVIGEIRFLAETTKLSFLLVSIRDLDDGKDGDIALFENVNHSIDASSIYEDFTVFNKFVGHYKPSDSEVIALLDQVAESDNHEEDWEIYEAWAAEMIAKLPKEPIEEEELESYGEY